MTKYLAALSLALVASIVLVVVPGTAIAVSATCVTRLVSTKLSGVVVSLPMTKWSFDACYASCARTRGCKGVTFVAPTGQCTTFGRVTATIGGQLAGIDSCVVV